MYFGNINYYFNKNNTYNLLDKTYCDGSGPNHAIFITGYKIVGSILTFTVKNSEGSKWGNEGFFDLTLDLNEVSTEEALMVNSNNYCGLFKEGFQTSRVSEMNGKPVWENKDCS